MTEMTWHAGTISLALSILAHSFGSVCSFMLVYLLDFYLIFYFFPLHILYLCDFTHYPWWLYSLDADDSQAHVQGNLRLAYRFTSAAASWTFFLGTYCVFFLPLEHICSPGLRRCWLCPLPSCHESLAPVITIPQVSLNQTSDSGMHPCHPFVLPHAP